MRTNTTILDSSVNYIDQEATVLTRARYQQISPLYDRVDLRPPKAFTITV